MPDPKQREADIRQEPLGGLADREGQKLHHRRTKTYAGLPDHEELVDKGDQDHEAHPDDPGPDGADRHRGVVVRVDHGADLGVRAVAREEGDLDLGLADGAGVLVWIVKVLAVFDEFFQALQGSGWEVGVGPVGVNQLLGELCQVNVSERAPGWASSMCVLSHLL